ncbi:hypothetical protein GCM10023149_03130 [Mucilaginibacter gynuensis]|uniref:40-residue YVTN family beta-propeller repeat-containing protein n=1 Tax=Mucilaginibacter gynuensis TaxID=1302236 RepID=A0ABP8FQM3_9SPHI
MKNLKINYLLISIALLSALSSCRKGKNDVVPDQPTAERAGVYILNQGGSDGKGSLSYYDYTQKNLSADIFNDANGRAIGNTPNDMATYGAKMYIVVNRSGTVEVVNPKNAKSIKQIKFEDKGAAREVRYIVFNKNKAFVTCSDGNVAVVDTATLTIEKYIAVGRNPEQMAISNNKLYVANSGGYSFPNYDKTVSVIDLNTLTETKKIEVPINPVSVIADAYGDVYVISMGNYIDVSPSFTRISSAADNVTSTVETSVGYGNVITINGDLAYIIGGDGKIKVYNVKTEAIVTDNFVTDGTAIVAPYAIEADKQTGEVFITDAKDYSSAGEVFAFTKDGKKEYTLEVGISPGKILFINK